MYQLPWGLYKTPTYTYPLHLLGVAPGWYHSGIGQVKEVSLPAIQCERSTWATWPKPLKDAVLLGEACLGRRAA